MKIAVDMVGEDLISKETAVSRIDPNQIDQLLHPNFDEKAEAEAEVLAKGLPASPGAATGRIYFTASDAEAAVANGAKGIVHAGTGNGSIHEAAEPALYDAAKKGIVVVRSARVPNGPTIESTAAWDKAGFVHAGTLNPQKARILLQLGLTKTNDPQKISEMFKQY